MPPDFSKYGVTSQANAGASCNGIIACAANLLTWHQQTSSVYRVNNAISYCSNGGKQQPTN